MSRALKGEIFLKGEPVARVERSREACRYCEHSEAESGVDLPALFAALRCLYHTGEIVRPQGHCQHFSRGPGVDDDL